MPLTAAYDSVRSARSSMSVGGTVGCWRRFGGGPKSRGVLFDLPEVVAGARSCFAARCRRPRPDRGGLDFDCAPEGGDAYVLKNVIHDWPEEDAVRILKNVRTAARAGARVLLCEFVIPDHDRDFHGKWVDIEMLVVAGARERTADEYRRLFDQAGYRLNRVVDTVSPLSIVEASAV